MGDSDTRVTPPASNKANQRVHGSPHVHLQMHAVRSSGSDQQARGAVVGARCAEGEVAAMERVHEHTPPPTTPTDPRTCAHSRSTEAQGNDTSTTSKRASKNRHNNVTHTLAGSLSHQQQRTNAC
eukprot:TRINITY_DN6628_c0_g1_i1.p2 TRINITY_DN6628_c0_g1~~TRINITY_DN6628_c0_g1_i1.p2  ORF type:complete len:125 (-),score=12.25 TRINITY_DN6628_c0_g1_i1:347-721(-)